MNVVALTLLTTVLGVDVGWQPLGDGGFEYIIQIEPQLLDTLKSGNDLVSDLPPELWGVRTYRITVGNGRLPRVGERPASAENRPAAAADGKSTAARSAEPRLDSDATNAEPNVPAEFVPPDVAGDLRTARPSREAPPGKSPVQQAGGAQYQLAVVTASLPPEPQADPEVGPVPSAVPPQASAPVDASTAGGPAKPWGLLALATLGLFLSLGFNAFLGWVTWGFRQRYTALVHELDASSPQTA